MTKPKPSAAFDCTRCGQRHPRGCTGHVEECTACKWRGGALVGTPCAQCGGEVVERACRNAPVNGSGVCRNHGAGAPQVKAEARRTLATAAALRKLQDVEIVPIGDPIDALAEVAAWARAWMLQMAQMVNELSEYRFTDEKGAEHLDARVALLERAADRLQKFLKDWVSLGFEERKVRVDEIRAGLLAVVLAGVLRDLGHDPEAEVVLGVLDRWLPVLDGAPAPVIDVKET